MPSFEEIKVACGIVPGWMSDEELKVLYDLGEKLPQECKILEIGVYKGKSLTNWALLATEKNGTVYGLDVFCSNKQNPDCPSMTKVQEDLQNRITNFSLIKSNSLDLWYIFPNGYFDLIFIDGGHDRETVTQDITNSLPLLKSGGILCGHDYLPTIKEAVVNEVVDELLGEQYVEVKNRIWIYTNDNNEF